MNKTIRINDRIILIQTDTQIPTTQRRKVVDAFEAWVKRERPRNDWRLERHLQGHGYAYTETRDAFDAFEAGYDAWQTCDV